MAHIDRSRIPTGPDKTAADAMAAVSKSKSSHHKSRASREHRKQSSGDIISPTPGHVPDRSLSHVVNKLESIALDEDRDDSTVIYGKERSLYDGESVDGTVVIDLRGDKGKRSSHVHKRATHGHRKIDTRDWGLRPGEKIKVTEEGSSNPEWGLRPGEQIVVTEEPSHGKHKRGSHSRK